MPVLQGRVMSGDVSLQGFNIPSKIISFCLTSVSGTAQVFIYIEKTDHSSSVIIYGKSIDVNTSDIVSVPITILPGYNIYLSTSNILDYYFTIE